MLLLEFKFMHYKAKTVPAYCHHYLDFNKEGNGGAVIPIPNIIYYQRSLMRDKRWILATTVFDL